MVIRAMVPDVPVVECRRFGSGCMFASRTVLGLTLSNGVGVLGSLTMLFTVLFGHTVGLFLLPADGPTT